MNFDNTAAVTAFQKSIEEKRNAQKRKPDTQNPAPEINDLPNPKAEAPANGSVNDEPTDQTRGPFSPLNMQDLPPFRMTPEYMRNAVILAELENLGSPMSHDRRESQKELSSSFYNSALQYTFTAVSRDSSFATMHSSATTNGESLHAVIPKASPRNKNPRIRKRSSDDTDSEAESYSDGEYYPRANRANCSDSDSSDEDIAGLEAVRRLRGLTTPAAVPSTTSPSSSSVKEPRIHSDLSVAVAADRVVDQKTSVGHPDALVSGKSKFFRRLFHSSTRGTRGMANHSRPNATVDVSTVDEIQSARCQSTSAYTMLEDGHIDDSQSMNYTVNYTAGDEAFLTSPTFNTDSPSVRFNEPRGTESQGGKIHRHRSALKSFRRSVSTAPFHRHDKTSHRRDRSSWKIWRRRMTNIEGQTEDPEQMTRRASCKRS